MSDCILGLESSPLFFTNNFLVYKFIRQQIAPVSIMNCDIIGPWHLETAGRPAFAFISHIPQSWATGRALLGRPIINLIINPSPFSLCFQWGHFSWSSNFLCHASLKTARMQCSHIAQARSHTHVFNSGCGTVRAFEERLCSPNPRGWRNQSYFLCLFDNGSVYLLFWDLVLLGPMKFWKS